MQHTDTRKDTVTFSSRGQVVVPRRLRRRFEIQKGTRAVVYEEDDHIVIKPMTRQYLQSLRGSLKGSGILDALKEDRKKEREI